LDERGEGFERFHILIIYLPKTDRVIEVGGRESVTMVRSTARDRNTVRTYDTFSPESTGTMKTKATISDVRIIGIITFRL
jgi:hypothetical protein